MTDKDHAKVGMQLDIYTSIGSCAAATDGYWSLNPEKSFAINATACLATYFDASQITGFGPLPAKSLAQFAYLLVISS